MRSFGGYCRIAFALGGASLRYAHNVRVTFRNARFVRFRDVLGGGMLRWRATAWAYRNAPHRPSIRNCANPHLRQCANARILSMQAMFGLAFDASVALGALNALAVFVRPNASLRDFSENVCARSCFAFVTVQ